MEEKAEGQFTLLLERYDGVQVNMQVRQKHLHSKKRHVKTWTMQEDQQLMKLYNAYPKKWAVIASLMTERNQNQCLHRYRRLSQLDAHHKIWSEEEDETIRKLMKKIGKNWKLLSEMLGSKTGKQIRERFINKLDPMIKKEDWSDEQDRKIIELYTKIGRRWSQISKNLPGRPENKIKNRFYSYIQKNYDICYHPLEVKNAIVEKQPNTQSRKSQVNSDFSSNRPVEFRQITSKIQNCSGQIEQIGKEEKCFMFSFPSINQMELQIKIEDQQENRGNKMMGGSMMKVEEEWIRKEKMDDFEPNVEAQNDLFYLSN